MAAEFETNDVKEHPATGRKAGTRTRVPDHEITEVRDIEFPMAMRGYDRAAVDAYVTRVNRLLAELQITAAPENAIRHALDEVAEETRGILERAHETAEDITRRSRSQADDRVQLAEHEAEETRTAADAYAHETRAAGESQLRALQADVDRVWQERDSMLSALRELAAQIEQLAAHAAERYPASPELHPPAVSSPSPADTSDDEEGSPLFDDD